MKLTEHERWVRHMEAWAVYTFWYTGIDYRGLYLSGELS